jgi:transposase-like protein
MWVRDADDDGKRAVHVTTGDGSWTTVRTVLRPFRGVHKTYLAASVAICEVRLNKQRIAPRCIAQLVRLHHF